jgi:DNA uptake protein ComE-like DNA-binding protein
MCIRDRLESIPGIGRASAKKLHTMFDSLADFISQINNADPDTSPLVSQIGPAKFEKLKKFVDTQWPNKPAERRVLKTYADKGE